MCKLLGKKCDLISDFASLCLLGEGRGGVSSYQIWLLIWKISANWKSVTETFLNFPNFVCTIWDHRIKVKIDFPDYFYWIPTPLMLCNLKCKHRHLHYDRQVFVDGRNTANITIMKLIRSRIGLKNNSQMSFSYISLWI